MSTATVIKAIVTGREVDSLDGFVRKYFVNPTWHDRWRLYDAFFANGCDLLLHAPQSKETFIVDARDNNMARSMFVAGGYQFEHIVEVLDRLKEDRPDRTPPRTLLDIGANMGVISIPAVARGLFDRAIAIEPTPSVCRLLRANVALNGLEDSIRVIQTALSDRAGVAEFELSSDNTGDNRISVVSDKNAYGEHSRAKIEVPLTRFDDLSLDVDLSSSLAWIDVQGYEGFVLAGAQRLTAVRTPLVIEFWPYGLERAGSYSKLVEALAVYERFAILGKPAGWHPISHLSNVYKMLEHTTQHLDLLVV